MSQGRRVLYAAGLVLVLPLEAPQLLAFPYSEQVGGTPGVFGGADSARAKNNRRDG